MFYCVFHFTCDRSLTLLQRVAALYLTVMLAYRRVVDSLVRRCTALRLYPVHSPRAPRQRGRSRISTVAEPARPGCSQPPRPAAAATAAVVPTYPAWRQAPANDREARSVCRFRGRAVLSHAVKDDTSLFRV